MSDLAALRTVAAIRNVIDNIDGRNWTEDASHENGDYMCKCADCGETFIGHKRRVVCKVCAKVKP